MNVSQQGVALSVPEQGDLPILPVAHDQIGTFTKIPAPYYDRMLREDPALLAHNVNTWLGRVGRYPNTDRVKPSERRKWQWRVKTHGSHYARQLSCFAL